MTQYTLETLELELETNRILLIKRVDMKMGDTGIIYTYIPIKWIDLDLGLLPSWDSHSSSDELGNFILVHSLKNSHSIPGFEF